MVYEMDFSNFFADPKDFICWNSLDFECKKNDIPIFITHKREGLSKYPNILSHRCVVIGGSDYDVTYQIFNSIKSFGIKKMIANNLTFVDKDVLCLPIGLPDVYDTIVGNRSVILKKREEDKSIKNVAFWGVRDSTYQGRSDIRKIFTNCSHVDKMIWDRTTDGYSKYIDNIYNHKFVICPRGNGIDTMRVWESLYLRTIPIVCNNIYRMYFEDLPILFVDKWEEVLNVDFLNMKYEEIMARKYDMGKLLLSYWIDRCKNF